MSVRRSDSAREPSRRDILKAAAAVTGGAALSPLVSTLPAAGEAAAAAPTLVGAIRWDAYTGKDTRHGMGANRMLSPEKYRFRLPFYSEITVPTPVLVDQTFDSETTGAVPSGWTVAAGTGCGVSIVDGPDRAGKSVHLHDASTSGMATMSRSFAGQARAVTARFDWKETVAGGWSRVLVNGGSTTVVDLATQQDTGGKKLMYRTTSGTWALVQAVADDTWYSIKIIIDPAPIPAAGVAPFVHVFVDGVRKVFQVPLLGSPAALDTLHFQTNPVQTTDLYVDNVHVEVTESVDCDETSQAIIDQEIQYAHAAGIDYWAIDYYSDAELRQARDLYLSSAQKNLVNWCALITEWNWEAYMDELVARFGESNYQKVLGGRPLLYFLGPTTVDRIASLKAKTAAAGLPDPYIVVMRWTAQDAADLKTELGADAVSRYAIGGGGTGTLYSSQAAYETTLWPQYAAAAGQVVPTVSTGWDGRPMYDYPVPWGAQPSDDYLTYKDQWTQQATPQQIATHLREAITWSQANQASNPANCVLIYAWNESLEGGWICPTLSEIQDSGTPLRLDAIAGVPRT